MCHHGDKHGRSRPCEAEFLRAHFRSSTSVLAGPHRLQHQQQQWNQFLEFFCLQGVALLFALLFAFALGLEFFVFCRGFRVAMPVRTWPPTGRSPHPSSARQGSVP